MSKKFNMVKQWWNTFHNISMIKNAVLKKYITEEEFTLITNQDYNTLDD